MWELIPNAILLRIVEHFACHGTNLRIDLKRCVRKLTIKTIFDVGANRGQSAKEFERDYPNALIYSFEPNPNVFPLLQRSTGPRTRAFPIGLSKDRGVFRFDNSGGIDTMDRLAKDQTDRRLPEVQVTTLDAFCLEHEISKIDLLKIDTEGHDLDVLKGAERMLGSSLVDVVIAECSMNVDNNYHVAFQLIQQHMEERGYRLFGIYEQAHEWLTKKPNLRRANIAYISGPTIKLNDYSWG